MAEAIGVRGYVVLALLIVLVLLPVVGGSYGSPYVGSNKEGPYNRNLSVLSSKNCFKNVVMENHDIQLESLGSIQNLESEGWIFKNVTEILNMTTQKYRGDFQRRYDYPYSYAILIIDITSDTNATMHLYIWENTTIIRGTHRVEPNVTYAGNYTVSFQNKSIDEILGRIVWVKNTIKIYYAVQIQNNVSLYEVFYSLDNGSFYGERELATIPSSNTVYLEDFSLGKANGTEVLILARSWVDTNYHLNATIIIIENNTMKSLRDYEINSQSISDDYDCDADLSNIILFWRNKTYHIFIAVANFFLNVEYGWWWTTYEYNDWIFLLYFRNESMDIDSPFELAYQTSSSRLTYYSVSLTLLNMTNESLSVFIYHMRNDRGVYNLLYEDARFAYNSTAGAYELTNTTIGVDKAYDDLLYGFLLDYDYRDSASEFFGTRYIDGIYTHIFTEINVTFSNDSVIINRTLEMRFYESAIKSWCAANFSDNATMGILIVSYDSERNTLYSYVTLGMMDQDHDYLSDYEETKIYSTNPLKNDTDEDLIWDGSEVFIYGTEPNNNDTDNDYLEDGEEIIGINIPNVGIRCTDPLDNDSDNDGILDGNESLGKLVVTPRISKMIYSDPLANDSDGDGLSDYFEFCVGWEVKGVTYEGTVFDYWVYSDPASSDFDDDDIPDSKEVGKSDPWVNDTDMDGLTDYVELKVYFTNVTDGDTDDDGASDYHEIFGVYLESLGKIVKSDPKINDSDGDGLLDGEEMFIYGTHPMDSDTDHDYLTDFEEVSGVTIAGITNYTDPTNPDSDGDGLEDGEELYYKSFPWCKDSDRDGLPDLNETRLGTQPLNPDSDSDTISDYEEIKLGINPLDIDTDDDGLNDSYELKIGSNPALFDSDGDGLSDGEEVLLYGTNPKLPDSDNDSLDDYSEVKVFGTNPLDNDTDGDGLTDSKEISIGTNPLKEDTDGDGLTDSKEISIGTDPRAPDSDMDGLSDGDEVNKYGTDPLDRDTDDDGIEDGDEVARALDPLSPDTDKDFLPDNLDPLPLINNFLFILPAILAIAFYGAYSYGAFRDWKNDILGVGLADSGGTHMFTIPPEFEESANASLISSGLVGILALTGEITGKEVDYMVLSGPAPVFISSGEKTMMWCFLRRSYPRIVRKLRSIHKKMEERYGDVLETWGGLEDRVEEVRVWLATKLKIKLPTIKEELVPTDIVREFEEAFKE